MPEMDNHGATPSGVWKYGEVRKRRLVIVGAGEFAEIAHEYFTHDSPYEVVGFSVDREFVREDRFRGLPVLPLDEVENHFSVDTHVAFVAVTYTRLNRVRARLFRVVKAKGYQCATYVSSRAFVWHTASIGENVFIFENNVVQHGVCIGNDVVLWSGNHIGHRSEIGDHCYLASHVVVSGYCKIGESSFLGVNATLADNVTVGANCLIGAGAVVLRDAPADTIYQGTSSAASKVSSLRFHRIGPNE
jgi:sugar O-acyltransferase (sialic acid O-acetyltransferase NeuD family)